MELKSLEMRFAGIKSRQGLMYEMYNSTKASIQHSKERKEKLDELQLIVQEASRRTQIRIKERFETIVQSCVDVVFPDSYRFYLEFVSRRGRTEVDIGVEKDGIKMDVMASNGGGLVDVISLALRVACLTVSGKDKILLLDEPTPHLRGINREKMGELLATLSKHLGIQIIMVGDVAGSTIPADREFMVTKSNGTSLVEVMND